MSIAASFSASPSPEIYIGWIEHKEATQPRAYLARTFSGGDSWSPIMPITDNAQEHGTGGLDLAVANDDSLWAVYNAHNESLGMGGMWYRRSTNGATTVFMEPTHIQDRGWDASVDAYPGGLVLSWTDDRCRDLVLGFCDQNVWYRTRSDPDGPWGPPQKYTKFGGTDEASVVAGSTSGFDRFSIAWQSERRHASPDPTGELGPSSYFSEPIKKVIYAIGYSPVSTVWFGYPEVHEDAAAPPAVVRLEHAPVRNPMQGQEIRVMARVTGDVDRMASPTVAWLRSWVDGVRQPDRPMKSTPQDLFVAGLGPFRRAGVGVRYWVYVVDIHGRLMVSRGGRFEVQEAFRKTRDVLLVLDSHNGGTVRHVAGFYGAALRAAGVHVDLWDSDLRGPPSSRILGAYRHGAVIWATPQYDSWLWDHPIDSRGVRERLSAFLEHGGSLFITGQHIAEHLGQGGDDERRWLGRNLRAGFGGQDGFQDLVGEDGDPIGDGIVAGLQDSGSILRPAWGARPVFQYGTTSAETYGVAAVRARQGQSRVVFFGFPFEPINVASIRNEVMSRVMGWINPTCNGRPSTIDGTEGSDTIRGTAHDDVIVTFAGMDFVWGGEGNDVICGGKDVDVLDGGPGNDWIDGMYGSDVLKGGPGDDRIYGHWGADIVLAGDGNDFVDAGIGNDQVSGGKGADVILGSWGNDILAGDDGDDVIFGGAGVDDIDCGGGADVAIGGFGADVALGCEWTLSIP